MPFAFNLLRLVKMGNEANALINTRLQLGGAGVPAILPAITGLKPGVNETALLIRARFNDANKSPRDRAL